MSKLLHKFKVPLIPSKNLQKTNKHEAGIRKTKIQEKDLLNMDESLFENIPSTNIIKCKKEGETSTPKTMSKDGESMKRKSNEIVKHNGIKIIRLNMTERSTSEHILDFSKDVDMIAYEKSILENIVIPETPPQEYGNDSLFGDSFETQCFRDIDDAVAKSLCKDNLDSNDSINKSCNNDLDLYSTQLNQMFNNADTDFDLNLFQSSQRFLTDLKPTINTLTQKLNEKSLVNFSESNITTNVYNNSKYIEMQREMHEINLENIDDDYLDNDLSQYFNSSDYLREVESDFINCEKTICNFGNDDYDSALNDVVLDYSLPVRNATASTSMIVKQKLEDLNIRKKESPVSMYKIKPVTSSYFCERGPFFGLPAIVKKFINEFKGITDLYDWQKECLKLPAITQRNNLIYALPTSGGKTLVAEILIMREVLCRQKNVIFVLPFVSIVQEKVWALSPFAVHLNFLVEEYAAGKGRCPPRRRRKKNAVFIATIEKSLALIDSLIESNRIDEIGMIVVDELHLLGEPGRGATLEMVLTKAIFVNAGIQIIGMSATIGNLHEVSQFLSANIYTRDFRPVELQEYIKTGQDILKINGQSLSLEEAFEYNRTVNYGYTPDIIRLDKDHIAGLVMEIIPDNSCLIFCSSKRTCQSLSLLLCNIFNEKYLDHRHDEKLELMKIIRRDTASPLCDILKKCIPYGVAYHHSGLTIDERRNLEDAFRNGVLCVICCTSTLAAGVNLPAKRVIIRSPYVGNKFISLSKYKQMVGRAGRAGMGESGDSILICDSKDNQKVAELLCSPMDETISQMQYDSNKGIRLLVLSAIGLNLANKRPDIRKLLSKTLLAVQKERLQFNLAEIVDQVIILLFKKKALQKVNHGNILKTENVDVEIIKTQCVDPDDSQISLNNGKTVKIFVNNTKPFEISKLGKAAVRACIDLEKANLLYKDLVQAQQSLVVSNYLHLLYIVTPGDKIQEIRPDMAMFYSFYTKLPHDLLKTVEVLGISEACALKMVSGKPLNTNVTLILKRLYVALMLQDLWNGKIVHYVSKKFDVDRGFVQQLMYLAASNAASILRFCEELEEFWALKELLNCLTRRLSHCCTNELLPLMDLPAVKTGRARQLYSAGYRNLELIASTIPKDLVDKVDNITYRHAKQLIAAAKLILLEKVETLHEEAQDVMQYLKN